MLGDIGLRLDELKGKFGEDWRGENCRRGEQDGRKKGGTLRQPFRRGSLDRTGVQPDIDEHASLKAQRVHGSKAHRSGSQDTSDGPE